jgi:hypothetical protein
MSSIIALILESAASRLKTSMIKKVIVLSLTLVLVLMNSVPLTAVSQVPRTSSALPGSRQYIPASPDSGVVPNTPGVTYLCGPGPGVPGGIYKGAGGAFVEDYNTGQLLWCASGAATVIANPPGSVTGCYFQMGGIPTSVGLVLVLDSCYNQLWFCFGATSNGCSVQSEFISFPSSFCSTMSNGICNPDGIALDKKLNIYYTDQLNQVLVRCTYASGYHNCSTLETLSDLPSFLYRASNGDLWVSDQGCSGNVWKNGVLQYTFGDRTGPITVSSANIPKSPHMYIAIGGGCGTFSYSFVFDITDGESLPSPFNPSTTTLISGLSTSLQISVYGNGNVYALKDKV